MNPYESVLEIKTEPCTEAQRALQQAVLQMNEEMEIYQISVKALCAKAHVARSTFYTYYRVIDDVMQEIENELVSKIITINRKFDTSDDITEDSLDFFGENLDLVMKNQKLFYLLLVKRPNHRFIQKWKNGIKYHFYYRLSEAKYGKDKELVLELIAAQTVAAYTFVLQNPYDVNINTIKKIILNTLKIYQ